MKVALKNMWATVQSYSRSISDEVLLKFGTNAIVALCNEDVFGPAVGESVRNSQMPFEDKLRTSITLALAADCLNAVLTPFCPCLESHSARDLEFNINPLMPLLKPLANCFAQQKSMYAHFVNMPKQAFTTLLHQYSNDLGLFGKHHRDTLYSGVKATAYYLHIKTPAYGGTGQTLIGRDTTHPFSKDILLAIFDKSAVIAGTAVECRASRDRLLRFSMTPHKSTGSSTPFARILPIIQKMELPIATAPAADLLTRQMLALSQIARERELAKQNALPPQQDKPPALDPPRSAPTPSASPITPVQSRADSDFQFHVLATAIDEAQRELHNLIGLRGVKEEVRRLMSFLTIQQERKQHGLPVSSQSLHFVFTGNPGTGKTTVARILGKIFFGFGILKAPKIIECDRSNLVGAFLGQTAIKTDEVIKSALDGVLFIDEAYTLAGDTAKYSHGDSYGDEAINTLLKRMEDNRDRLIVIAAGYPAPMKTFLKTNPGLGSRFTRLINFEDYSVPELCHIFEKFCSHSQYTLTATACAKAFLLFTAAHLQRDERFGNARFVRNVYEQTISLQSDRLTRAQIINKMTLATIVSEDIPLSMVSGIDLQSIDITQSRWIGECPGCKKTSQCGVKYIGQSVNCKCGQKFVFPWWNLKVDSVPGFPAALSPSISG